MTKWPNEVRNLFLTAVGNAAIDNQNAEKLRAHINRLWLVDTPEETIIHEISILADAMEGEPCAK
ncbi:hypothetical protein ACFXK6_000764 [Citrobacter koseri]|uniref:hypothetical protein n=1 Tax=Citrobacter TaxID=544 RepID=UPI001883F99D|nr:MULTISPECIES: hypothetical protein [Citrobacter]ELJ2664911.1 hypothetical protein [Citrobacter koseri]MBE9969164.1 hypothetical protein [Citrobacter freundii]MBE9975550.1 hypothetical protein [Citrobacter freundii]MBE9985137.1 hypothetical protein [Citrobacter freundii]MBF0064505.1 hypothetical protein [Citrobacter freundii]